MKGASGVGVLSQSVLRRWLEVVLPLYTAALVLVWFHAEYTPAILSRGMGESLIPGLAWVAVGALTGILGLWAVVVGFFLLYSPFYLLGRLPVLVGRGPWADRREVRFYLACFVLLCLVVGVGAWDPTMGLVVFAFAAGCGPVFWRLLV